MSAFADRCAVIFDPRYAAGAKPFDVADIRYLNSGLDAVLKYLESDGTRRHRADIEYSKNIYSLPHDDIYMPPLLASGMSI